VVDDDFDNDVAFKCRSAVVVVAAERGIKPTPELLLAGCRQQTWEGGGYMYDDNGYMLPSPEMIAFGVTADDLMPLGFVPAYGPAMAFVRQLLAGRGVPIG